MSVEAIGESVGRRYRIVEAISTGGLGRVYKAVDTRLQRLVALKVLPVTPDAESRQRFLQESQVLASLSHPNIVQIYDVGEANDYLYLAVEYVEGRTLRQIMVDAQRLDLDYILEITFQVSVALGYAHRRGIIHRDIKPENIMISIDGRVLLLDFGLAIAPGEATITHAGTIVGTVAYMSPEQLLGRPVDARSDIFALGLVFYELLTGRRAFSAESLPTLIRNIIEQEPSPPRSIEHTIPAAIDEVAMKLLAKEPDQRFQTIDQFLTALSTAKRSSQKDTGVVDESGCSIGSQPDIDEVSSNLEGAVLRSAALPPPPLIPRSTFDSTEEPTTEFTPYSPSSAGVPEALRLAQDVFDRYRALFAQGESGADIPHEVRRRLEEFDAIWDQLTTSTRHD